MEAPICYDIQQDINSRRVARANFQYTEAVRKGAVEVDPDGHKARSQYAPGQKSESSSDDQSWSDQESDVSSVDSLAEEEEKANMRAKRKDGAEEEVETLNEAMAGELQAKDLVARAKARGPAAVVKLMSSNADMLVLACRCCGELGEIAALSMRRRYVRQRGRGRHDTDEVFETEAPSEKAAEIGRAGGVEAILNALARFVAEPRLVARACFALEHVLKLDINKSRYDIAKGAGVVRSCRRLHLENEAIQASIDKILEVPDGPFHNWIHCDGSCIPYTWKQHCVVS